MGDDVIKSILALIFLIAVMIFVYNMTVVLVR